MDIQLSGKNYRPQRIFCIGRNYVAHIKELSDQMPEEPVIFTKPATSLVPPEQKDIPYPANTAELHYETELVVLIGKEGKPADEKDALSYIAGLAVGVDLTLRDAQRRLLSRGLPWDICKGFDKSAPTGHFQPYTPDMDLTAIEFYGKVNGELRQHGDTGLMIFPVPVLLLALSKYWKLLPGDLLFTGTPEGVGELKPGDTVDVTDFEGNSFCWNIC